MYEIFVACRYLTARRKQAFISVITFISILGISIGVMALVIAIALITGFQSDVQEKILGSTSHLTISDFYNGGFKDYQPLAERIEQMDGIRSVTPVAYEQGLVKGPRQGLGAMIKGLDLRREAEILPWLQNLEQGHIPESDLPRPGILLGKDLALKIGAGVGDTVEVYISVSRTSPIGGLPKVKRFEVTGIFNTGLYDVDLGTAVISIEAAQSFFNMKNRVSYLQIMIDRIFTADRKASEIKEILPPNLFLTTWMELNKSIFSALKLEKTIIFLTITLIVIVAALNIIASLILMVMEKSRDIGVLIAMGATARNIRNIFFLQGAMIGVVGTAAGTALGLIWCWLANTFQLIKVPVDIYQISYVPFTIRPVDLALIIGVTLLIAFVSTIFPSYRASKVDPVMALKYE